MKQFQKQKKKGFTLIELMVAMGLFAFVLVAAVTAMMAVLDANQRAQSSVRAMDALSFGIESMTREIRVGSSYNCTADPSKGPGPVYNTNDCANGRTLGLISSDNEYIVYRYDAGTNELQRCKSDPGVGTCGGPFVPMTGPTVSIDDLDFHVIGSPPTTAADEEQPLVVITIRGTAGAEIGDAKTFSLQTSITQRFPDF